MPERTTDNNKNWPYPTVFPGADTKKNWGAIQQPQLAEAVGLDGRFVGALRPFPGMADDSIHGVPHPETGVTTIESVDNIIFVKYVSIQKGTSKDAFKGLAFIGDNQNADGQAIYFSYYDSSDGSSDVIMLEDFASWDDFKINETLSSDQVDITSMGRYIYLCVSADTTSTVTSFQNKEAPYNKAYFYDFKINDWDSYSADTFLGRFMGLQPQRVLSTPINRDKTTGSLDSEDTFDTQVAGGSSISLAEGNYTFACEVRSRKHNIRSYFRMATEEAIGTPRSTLRFFIDELLLPTSGGGQTNQIKSGVSELSCLIHWGIPHCDGFRLYRSIRDDSGRVGDLVSFKYTPIGGLYVVEDYHEKDTPSASTFRIPHNETGNYMPDSALVEQTKYDPFLDEVGPPPRMKRLQAFDGLLVGTTETAEPTTPDEDWELTEQMPEAIVWSSVVNSEPENFPVANHYRPDDAAERFMSLEPVGDHLFGVTNAAIYKVSRSGATVGVNRLLYRLGGIHRFAQTGVGSSLFIVTKAGLKEVDGNTGEIRSISALDRVILDDSEWAGSLTSVFLEYDAVVGALVLLNTTKQEAYIMWESSGAITKLEEIPWTFLTGGPDVKTDGPQRAYFVTSDGRVHVIDGAREMGKRTMCGTLATETVNGTVTSGSTATVIYDTAADDGSLTGFPLNCEGFRIYMLSGDLEGESALIDTRDSATQLTLDATDKFSGSPAVGDKYSISPVYTRITLAQVTGDRQQIDPFARKILHSIMASFSDLGGETGGSDTNGSFTFGMKQMETTLATVASDFNLVPDKTIARLSAHSTRLFPFLEFKGSNQDWELQAVQAFGQLSRSEAQSRQV